LFLKGKHHKSDNNDEENPCLSGATRKNPEQHHLLTATTRGNLKQVKKILEQVDDPNSLGMDGAIALHIAAYDGHVDILKAIMEKVSDNNNPADNNGRTLLHVSAEWGQLQVVQYMFPLLEDKCPKDIDGQTPLHLLSQRPYAMLKAPVPSITVVKQH
jgi:ankyrin repeat protein